MRTVFGVAIIMSAAIGSTGYAQMAPSGSDCRQTVVQIEARGTAYVQAARAQGRPLPNAMVLRNRGGFALGGGGGRSGSFQTRLQAEAYYRPLEDGDFRLPVFPLLGARVTRDRDLVHVCVDHSSERSRLVVHFLRSYNVGGGLPALDEIIRGREMRVRAVPVTVLGVSDLVTVIGRPFRGLPLIGWLVQLPSDVIRDLGQVLGQTLALFSGTGIERLTIENDVLELAYGIDRENPARARVSRLIYLRQPSDRQSGRSDFRVETPAESER